MSTTRVTIPVMAVCIGLSVIVHVGSAVGAGAYLSQRPALDFTSQTRITLPDMLQPPIPDEQPLRLGREESSTASIAWLGVVQDAVEGQGQESQVEQAELTIQPGEREAEFEPPTQPAPPIENPPVSVPEPTQPEISTDAMDHEPVMEPAEQAEPEPEEHTGPIEDQSPEPVVESSDRDEPAVEPEAQPQPEPMPEETNEPSSEQAQPENTTESQPVVRPTLPTTSPKPQGKPGDVDDRESVASIIKGAQEVRATTLNRPLSGEGLEIKPVEPKFSATVRFTQLPHNPIVLIRFNAQGKVVKAEFLRDEAERRVYDTGSKGVDEPLINAIYQWRAEGKQIDALDPADPESTIEIAMKIIFRPE